MKIGIIGAGAIGAITAYNLRRANEVTLIVDKGRKERYAQGFDINGETVLFPLRTPEEAVPLELVIFSVKYPTLPEAMEEAAPFIGEDTTILSILNGLEAEEMLEKRFGSRKVLKGFIKQVSSTHSGKEIRCTTGGGTIVFGEPDNAQSERIRQIRQAFDAAGQRYIVPEDIMHEKYWKVLLNSCFNTLSASLSADFHAIYGNEPFLKAVRMVGSEVQLVAKAQGVLLTDEDMEKAINTILSHPDHGRTSMYQDVEAGRETENEYLAGYILKTGRKLGIPTPYTELAYTLLEARRVIVKKDKE